MSLFKTVPMYVKSVTGGYIDGKWSQTEGNAISFNGTLQPLNGKDTQILPEGRRAGENYKVYSDLEFETVTSSNNPNIINVNNINYEILSKESWQNTIINHYKYIVQKVTTK